MAAALAVGCLAFAAEGSRSRHGAQLVDASIIHANTEAHIDVPDFLKRLQALLNSEATPLEYAGIFFTVFAVFYFIKTWLLDIPSAEECHKARSALIQLIKTYEVMSTRWIHRLGLIDEAESAEAEYTFLRRQDELQTSLSALQHTLDKGTVHDTQLGNCDTECVDAFRTFMLGWLKVFRQCSPKPLEKPYVILPDEALPELKKLTSMSEVIRSIGRHLEESPFSSVATAIEQFQTKHMQRTESLIGGDSRKSRFWLTFKCGGIGITSRTRSGGRAPFPLTVDFLCVKIEMLSPWHCRLLLYLLFGIAVFVLNLGTGMNMMSIASGVGVLFIVVALLLFVNQVDEHARLVWDAKKMESEIQQAEADLAKIEKTFHQMDRVLTLWRYQTLPRLDVYACVLDVLVANLPQGQEVIQSIADQMQYVEHVQGSMELWTGPKAVQLGYLQAAAKQFAEAARPMQEATRAKEPRYNMKLGLDGHFAIVTISVMAAYNLPNMDEDTQKPKDLTDACVVVKVGKESHRTSTVKDSLNPCWDEAKEKFILTATGIDRVLKVEVYDDDNDQQKGLFEAIGYVEVPFRAKPGEWVPRRERLQSMEHQGARKDAQGDVEFKFHFAQTMQDLGCMAGVIECAPDSVQTNASSRMA